MPLFTDHIKYVTNLFYFYILVLLLQNVLNFFLFFSRAQKTKSFDDLDKFEE